MKTSARVVVVGGGVVGASVLYHLTKRGWDDVVLLERKQLTCGTTWHAAGLVGQLRGYQNLTRLIRYSTELYASLEAETGLATGWKQCGSLSVARTPERMTYLRRTAAMANAQRVACEELTPKQAGEKYPIMRIDDLVGAIGVDAARYALARSSADSQIDIDLDLWARKTSDNPVFYVQYAATRAASVLRNAKDLGIEPGGDLALLTHERENELLLALAEFPRVVANAAELREPHRVARYLEDTGTSAGPVRRAEP